jgi:nicotinamide mononucleotide transporter
MLFSLLEVGAVLCALAYMVLVAREHIACWFFAFVSTALFTVVFFEAALSFSMALNIYYMIMAGYGYWQWQQGTVIGGAVVDGRVSEEQTTHPTELTIHSRSLGFHLLVITGGLLMSGGFIFVSMNEFPPLLALTTEHWIQILDIVVSIFSVLATVMVAHKIYENWFYWMGINTLAIVLYTLSDLTMSAGLFAVYLVFAIYGWRQWRH